MICALCGGSPGGGGGGSSSAWASSALKELAKDVSRTCFCGVSAKQMQSVVDHFENRLEQFLMTNYPGKDMEKIRLELAAMPRQSNMRIHTTKRLQYKQRIKEKLRLKKLAQESIEDKEEEQRLTAAERLQSIQPDVPSDSGVPLKIFSDESGE